MARLEAVFERLGARNTSKNQPAPQNPSRSRVKSRLTKRGFQNTNPERGRKRYPSSKRSIGYHHHFRTQTPKGDGNLPSILYWMPMSISEHKPRKGTETAALNRLTVYPPTDFRTQTPKGDGNYSHDLFTILVIALFQNTNPERGRKRRTLICNNVSLVKFQNTNPERGRKLSRLALFLLLFLLFQNTNPERGRKHR